MYYRQKILLALLEEFGGSLSNTDFEKLLFLYCKRTNSNYYDFFPYKYGAFSFVSYADKRKLTETGNLADDDRFELLPTTKTYLSQLKQLDKKAIKVFATQTRNLRGRKLIRTVYNEFPEFARNSKITSTILNAEEYQRVSAHWQANTDPALMTIGYEGLSVDAYINKLINNDVTALVDVRKNPISRKFGFSKKRLSNYINRAGMSYYHLPELGVPSHFRKNLDSIDSYKALFIFYEKQILFNQKEAIDSLKHILKEHNRIALTCFEADYHMCHRSKLVEELQKDLSNSYGITHL